MDRQSSFTTEEFLALPRYANGRLKDLPYAFPFLTGNQVKQLHEDDWSYYLELEEELNSEIELFHELCG